MVINLVAQEPSGHGGDLVTNLVTQEQSGRLEAIWSPIRSPGHLVVDLVVVDAFSLSTTSLTKVCQRKILVFYAVLYSAVFYLFSGVPEVF